MKYRKEFKQDVIKTYLINPYLTSKEIAESYNISVATLKRWVKEFYEIQRKFWDEQFKACKETF